MTSAASTTTHKVLVVGSTGATGKHVVQYLLARGDTQVVALTRSEDRLMGLLNLKDKSSAPHLSVKEASIGNMTHAELQELTQDCTAVVSCLGHNLSFKGMFREGYFVSEAVKSLTTAMPKDSRFVLMGSDGVAHPDGTTDPKRSGFERGVLRLMRWLLPPIRDNEKAAQYMWDSRNNESLCDWVVVRPCDLVDKEEELVDYAPDSQKYYQTIGHTFGGLFGDNAVARSDVAHCFADLATMEATEFQKTYSKKMPVVFSPNKESDDTLMSTHD